MKILVTGAAGFIGMHVARKLLGRGDTVIGIDNLNDYYDPKLKQDRLAQLTPYPGFRFELMDIADRLAMASLFDRVKFDRVVHLAAQAGVRYSIKNPNAYIDSNLVGFANVLEGCRHQRVEHLVYASSSSVYGSNTKIPFSEEDTVDHPISLYAATKKANELMAHSYSHLYGLPTTGLRFFTVYGPWGRPDMAYFLFVKSILEGRPINVFNSGAMRRDFTYIEDVIEGVVRVLDRSASPMQNSQAPFRVFNIGNHEPVEILEFIGCIEACLGKTAQKNMLPMQEGDVPETFADISALHEWVGFRPSTPIRQGLTAFINWYRGHYADSEPFPVQV